MKGNGRWGKAKTFQLAHPLLVGRCTVPELCGPLRATVGTGSVSDAEDGFSGRRGKRAG